MGLPVKILFVLPQDNVLSRVNFNGHSGDGSEDDHIRTHTIDGAADHVLRGQECGSELIIMIILGRTIFGEWGGEIVAPIGTDHASHTRIICEVGSEQRAHDGMDCNVISKPKPCGMAIISACHHDLRRGRGQHPNDVQPQSEGQTSRTRALCSAHASDDPLFGNDCNAGEKA